MNKDVTNQNLCDLFLYILGEAPVLTSLDRW